MFHNETELNEGTKRKKITKNQEKKSCLGHRKKRMKKKTSERYLGQSGTKAYRIFEPFERPTFSTRSLLTADPELNDSSN